MTILNKMVLKKAKYIFLIPFLTFLINSCVFARIVFKKSITVENKVLPPEMAKDTFATIFILREKRGLYNFNVKRLVKSKYPGKYIFLTKEELNKDNMVYNSNEFKYVFEYSSTDIETYIRGEYTSLESGFVTITDRQNGRIYKGPSSGIYRVLISEYMIKFKKIGLENKK